MYGMRDISLEGVASGHGLRDFALRFVDDSPLEGEGFEPSVPREGNYAQTAAFDRYDISLRPRGADSFAKRPKVRTPFPPPSTLSQG